MALRITVNKQLQEIASSEGLNKRTVLIPRDKEEDTTKNAKLSTNDELKKHHSFCSLLELERLFYASAVGITWKKAQVQHFTERCQSLPQQKTFG